MFARSTNPIRRLCGNPQTGNSAGEKPVPCPTLATESSGGISMGKTDFEADTGEIYRCGT